MAKKGLTEAKSNPDLTVTYYLLLTVNVETQQFGQFLPTAVIWEVPLFATGTQSVKVLNKGSLVLDYDGRIVIDTARHQFVPAALTSDRPVDAAQIAPISPDKIRRYELSADTFVVTYLDASGKPTAIARWRR